MKMLLGVTGFTCLGRLERLVQNGTCPTF